MANKKTAAREAARQQHAEQLRKEKLRARITTWTIVGIIIVMIAVAVWLFMRNTSTDIPEQGPAPAAANEYGGITMVSPTELADGNAPEEVNSEDVGKAQISEEQPQEIPGGEGDAKVNENHIVIYADPNCVHCASFDQENAQLLNHLLETGNATVEYRMVNYLDNPGTQNYSSRAANAMQCVAEEHPEKFGEYVNTIFAHYDQSGAGMKNDQLKTLADDMGANVDKCINNNTYRPFVNFTSKQAQADAIGGTPSIWINGKNTAIISEGRDMAQMVADEMGLDEAELRQFVPAAPGQ